MFYQSALLACATPRSCSSAFCSLLLRQLSCRAPETLRRQSWMLTGARCAQRQAEATIAQSFHSKTSRHSTWGRHRNAHFLYSRSPRRVVLSSPGVSTRPAACAQVLSPRAKTTSSTCLCPSSRRSVKRRVLLESSGRLRMERRLPAIPPPERAVPSGMLWPLYRSSRAPHWSFLLATPPQQLS